MLLVRENFTAKPGCAGKLAKLLKEVMEARGYYKTKIMTDLTGDFNQVVMETETESLADFEARIKDHASNPAVREKMAEYTNLWLTGGRTIYRIVE